MKLYDNKCSWINGILAGECGGLPRNRRSLANSQTEKRKGKPRTRFPS